jgi:hypothetical protein
LQYYVHAITEIIAMEFEIDCEFLVHYCPNIEKLESRRIVFAKKLKHTRLKYLCIIFYAKPDLLIKNLPHTIESLIIYDCDKDDRTLLCNQLDGSTYQNYLRLNKFPHLKYLHINQIDIWEVEN